MKVLVVGGAGFIGSHLVEKLVEQGHGVVVLDDLSAGKMSNLKNVYRLMSFKKGSVCNRKLVELFASGVDVIFHLATQCLVKGLGDPRLMHEVNDIGTFNVLLAAKKHNSKVVFIGTSEEYGPQKEFPITENAPMNPVSIYGFTKLVAERYVKFFHKVYEVSAVIIRPFNTFGPRQREDAYAGVITSFVKRLRAYETPIIQGDGLQTRDFTYVSDIVDGILLLSKLKDGEVVNLGSGKDFSIRDLADQISIIWKGHRCNPEHVDARVNDLRRLRADISLARSYGYEPKVSLKEGLEKYVEWYKSARDRK